MNKISDKYYQSLDAVKRKILPAKSVLVVPHDFPDPDSIGGALGMQHFFRTLGVKTCDIAFAGFVGRAENRSMLEELDIEYLNLSDIDLNKYEKIITVDSLPENGNISIDDTSIVDLVIDHHPAINLQKSNNTHYEIHTDIGATSTLVTLFLVAEEIPIPPKIATALFYGIKTDTNDMARNCHDVDIFSYKILFDLIEHQTLSRIESPERDIEYFQLLHKSAEELIIYDNIGLSHIGEVTIPDYVPEMADIFHSMKDLEWMICSAIFSDNLIFSIRSKTDNRAGNIARRVAFTLKGSGGGHPTMAAGRIPIELDNTAELIEIFNTVVLESFNIIDDNAKKIVEINNMQGDI